MTTENDLEDRFETASSICEQADSACLQEKEWRAQQDSNLRPLDPEPFKFLRSLATKACRT